MQVTFVNYMYFYFQKPTVRHGFKVTIKEKNVEYAEENAGKREKRGRKTVTERPCKHNDGREEERGGGAEG